MFQCCSLEPSHPRLLPTMCTRPLGLHNSAQTAQQPRTSTSRHCQSIGFISLSCLPTRVNHLFSSYSFCVQHHVYPHFVPFYLNLFLPKLSLSQLEGLQMFLLWRTFSLIQMQFLSPWQMHSSSQLCLIWLLFTFISLYPYYIVSYLKKKESLACFLLLMMLCTGPQKGAQGVPQPELKSLISHLIYYLNSCCSSCSSVEKTMPCHHGIIQYSLFWRNTCPGSFLNYCAQRWLYSAR